MNSLATLVLAAVPSLPTADAAADLAPLPALREFKLNWEAQPEQPQAPTASGDGGAQPQPTEVSTPGFGSAGSHWLTVGGAAAHDFDEDYDFNLHFAWSTFLADRFEFGVEAAAWYFDQTGENTGGISGMFVFRYHWWSGPRGDFDWTSFLDVGTGMLAGFDEVPDGGTGFNFIQRAGAGITKDLDASDGPAHGARLVCGLRWHHISNGRAEGDGRNPSRDALLAFVGVQWDF